jgi:hypothetical protein
MDENDLYMIDCENIENIISKIKNKPIEEVSASNDKKYRELRKTIMIQRKEIDDLKSKIKILETIVNKN